MSPFWSELPPEILALILQRLPLPDCFTFGKVCKRWRLVWSQRRSQTIPPPFMTKEPTDQAKSEMLWGNYPLPFMTKETSDQSKSEMLWGVYRRPSSLMQWVLHGSEWIVGTLMDWVVVAYSDRCGLYLLNLTTRSCIPLPSMLEKDEWCQFSMRSQFCMYYDYSDDYSFNIKDVHLSSPPNTKDNCILVAKGSFSYDSKFDTLVWCRLGCSKWDIFDEPWFDVVDTAFALQNGKLYVVCQSGRIFIYTFENNPILVRECYAPITSCIICGKDNRWSWRRFVESRGEVLMVVSTYCQRSHHGSRDAYFHVFKADPEGWTKIESLGDRLLVMNHCDGVCFTTKDLVGQYLEPNCIYYVKDLDLVKYSLAEGREFLSLV